jgi:cytochrome c1
VALAPVPSSPYCSAERKPPPVGGEEGSESQPLVSKRERRRKELFPQQQLSLSPFPNESKIAEAKRRKVEAALTPSSTVARGRRGEKLQESRIPTPSLRPKAKLEATTPQRTPGGSASADTTPEGEAATGPKDYSCRDCKRKFCRRGDRDNHELLCGHTKWRNGQTLALGFVELD